MRGAIRGQLEFVAHLYVKRIITANMLESFFFQMNLSACEDDVFNMTQMLRICRQHLAQDRISYWLQKLRQVQRCYGKRIQFVIDDLFVFVSANNVHRRKHRKRHGKKKVIVPIVNATKATTSEETQTLVCAWLRETHVNWSPYTTRASLESDWPSSTGVECERLRLACRVLLTMRANDVASHTKTLANVVRIMQCSRECVRQALRLFEQDVLQHHLHEDMPKWREMIHTPLSNLFIDDEDSRHVSVTIG